MKIKRDDKVQVLIGKDKGRQGQVIKVFPKKNKLLVKDINVFKKHVKPSQGKPGGIISREVPLYISKVALVCPSCKKAVRVSYQIDEKTNKKSRICQKCKKPIDKIKKTPVKKTKSVKKTK